MVPEFSGKHGHPYLVGREMMEAFLRVPATATAREVEHTNQGAYSIRRASTILSSLLNVNTPEEYGLSAP